jgi:predicted RNase H-like nuclease
MPMSAAISIVGFDSAWTDNPKAPGAVCSIRIDRSGFLSFVTPSLAGFSTALSFIRNEHASSDLCLVALDQPTIVPNGTGMRPVDKVAASLISWLGGGVQPANRSKVGMFDDAAPIWKFKSALAAIEDPELARTSPDGLFLIEVFPALALASFEPAFFGRLKAPRYNPQRRRTFRPSDWQAVITAIRAYSAGANISQAVQWLDELVNRDQPLKSDQDKLDALICALVGYHWLARDRHESIVIGDISSGYVVAPIAPDILALIRNAAEVRAVTIK